MAEDMKEAKVRLTRVKGTDIAKISIQNPPMNQLSGEVLMTIAGYLEKIRTDDRVKALIIEGRGLFSAGADVNEIYAIAERGSVEEARELLAKANAVVDAIENLGKPTVASISGLCLGGGNELAMGCDVRIASDDSKFGQPEIKLGIIPGMGGTQRLPRLVSDPKIALRLLFSGEMVSAQDALTCGLVDEVVSKSELDSKAIGLANSLISKPRQTKFRVIDPEEFGLITSSDLFKSWIENKSTDAVLALIEALDLGLPLVLGAALLIEQKCFAELVVKGSARAGLSKLAGKARVSKGGRFILPSETLPDIFTISDLSEDQRLIRDSVREVVANTIGTAASSVRIEAKDYPYSRQLMKEFADLGILGIEVPEEYGGVNLGTVVAAMVAEEISVQGSFATTIMAHTGIGTLPIRYFGTEDQKNRYLPRLVSGELISAYSLTEGSAGSDANSIRATAKLSDDGRYFVINGEKIFVTNGGFADLFIVFAKIDGKDLTAFIVEKEFEGLRIGKEEHKMGIQGSSTATIVLDSVKVPVENLLGERGKGFKIAMNILNLGRFKLGAACLGSGRLCLKEALAYSRDRKQFGLPIFTFEAIRRKIAEMAVKNYEMESIVYRTAGLLEEGTHNVDVNDSRAVLKAIEEFAVECSIVKVACSEALDFIVDENVQVHGGSGFCEELPPARHYRDSRINRIFEGTNEINRLVMCGMILKKALTGTLPVMDAVANVIREVGVGNVPSEPSLGMTGQEIELADLKSRLDKARKMALLSFGMAYETYGLGLEKHQMVLMNLADCLMAVYILESVLASFKKNRNDINLIKTRLSFSDNLFKLERSAKELAGMCSRGEKLKGWISLVNELTEKTPDDVKALSNSLCDKLVGL